MPRPKQSEEQLREERLRLLQQIRNLKQPLSFDGGLGYTGAAEYTQEGYEQAVGLELAFTANRSSLMASLALCNERLGLPEDNCIVTIIPNMTEPLMASLSPQQDSKQGYTHIFTQGNISTLEALAKFLRDCAIKVGYNHIYPAVKEGDVQQALKLLWENKRALAWVYRDALIAYDIITPAEFQAAFKKQVLPRDIDTSGELRWSSFHKAEKDLVACQIIKLLSRKTNRRGRFPRKGNRWLPFSFDEYMAYVQTMKLPSYHRQTLDELVRSGHLDYVDGMYGVTDKFIITLWDFVFKDKDFNVLKILPGKGKKPKHF